MHSKEAASGRAYRSTSFSKLRTSDSWSGLGTTLVNPKMATWRLWATCVSEVLANDATTSSHSGRRPYWPCPMRSRTPCDSEITAAPGRAAPSSASSCSIAADGLNQVHRLGLALDQSGAFSGTGSIDRFARGLPHRHRVVAVHMQPRHQVRRRAIREALHRRALGDGRVFGIAVVLTHEDHRQLPHRGHVQCLVESADVAGAVTEVGHCHVLGAAHLGGQRQAIGDRHAAADDAGGDHHAALGMGDVHPAALPLAGRSRLGAVEHFIISYIIEI
jgi:hypothetical protein